MRKIIILLFIVSTSIISANDWGPTGHRATAKIAEKYLKRSVKRKIQKLLKGESLAQISTYADDIKSDRRYDKYYTWHFVNMPLDATYQTSEKNPKGDLITGINYCVKVLKDKKASDDDKRFFLKLLVHLIGDMHQPMHVGLKEDRGANDIKVKWHYHKSNLHRVWDEDLINKWEMSYTELASNAPCLSKNQVKDIQKGSYIDWLHDTHSITKKVYADIKGKEKLSYPYSYKWMPTVRTQLQKGGIRLAKVLNDIF